MHFKVDKNTVMKKKDILPLFYATDVKKGYYPTILCHRYEKKDILILFYATKSLYYKCRTHTKRLIVTSSNQFYS